VPFCGGENGFVRIILIGMASLLALAACAEPETQADRWRKCRGEGGANPAQAIAACTAIIDGAEKDQKLAGALRHRGERLVARSLTYRGAAYERQGNFTGASADFGRAASLDSRNAGALAGRARAHARDRDFDAALRDLDQALSLDPRDAVILHTRGQVHHERGDWVRAATDLDAAAQLDPENPSIHNLRCWTRAVAGQELDVARQACDAAIRISKGGGYCLDSRGLVGIKQGRFADAWADYDAALRGEPNSAHYLYGRGVAALRLGREAEGGADVARAAQRDSTIAETYVGYGVTP
jgi:tetratricopeptide (TPR) repeat protein